MDDVLTRIEKTINKIRPYIQHDGGDVELVDYKDGVVTVRMLGACAGCMSLDATLTDGIEAILLDEVPEVKKVVERINYLQPDIVVFTGDLVDKNYKIDSSEQEKIITELSKIKAAVGKYAIDGDEDEKYFNTIFNQCGFSILNNSYDLIYNNTNEPLLLAGVSSSLKKENNIDEALNYFSGEGVNNNIYTIVLEHEPDLTDDVLNKHSSDLILAGHSHNGSIRTPWKSTIFKVVGANKYDNEYYKFENSELFISSGIGTNGSGIRLFCMPSISLYRLSRE